MMLSLCLGLALFAVAGALLGLTRDIAHPAVLGASHWGIVFVALALFAGTINEVSPDTQLIACLGGTVFVVGAVLGAGSGAQRVRAPLTVAPPAAGCWLLLAVAVLGLPLFIRRAYELSALGPTDNMLVNLRLVTGGDELALIPAIASFGPLQYLAPVSVVALAGGLLSDDWPQRRVYLGCAAAVALAYAVLSTGRTFLFQLLMIWLGARLMHRQGRPLRALLVIIAIALVAFVGAGMLSDKIGASMSASDALIAYFVGSMPAFDQHIHQLREFAYGANSFRTLSAVAQAIGVHVDVPPLVKEFRLVPFPTNVYSVFRPYWDDFGIAGVTGAMLGLGWLHGRCYRNATRGSGPFALAYVFLIYPLVMQFFQDQYFSLMSQWIQFAALSTVLYWPSLFRRREPAHGSKAGSVDTLVLT